MPYMINIKANFDKMIQKIIKQIKFLKKYLVNKC